MRRVIGTLGLVAILSVCVGISRAYGAQQPASPSIRWLHLADCALPCWNGVTIGKTAVTEAYDRIRQAFPDYETQLGSATTRGQFLNDGTMISFVEQSISLRSKTDPQPTLIIVLVVQDASHVTQEISFLTVNQSPLPTIPELSAFYGVPICLIQNRGRGNTPLAAVFQSRSIQITARVLNRGSGWQQHVYELHLSAKPVPAGVCDQWSGFTNLSRYLPR